MHSIFALYGDIRQATPRQATPTARTGRIATVTIDGVMSRGGEYGTSTDAVAREIRGLAADATVSGISLLISSPGGAVPGTKDLADAVAAATAQKYVAAYIQDIGCSAAYWVASQATKVYSDAMAIVGSIGTYTVIRDVSGLATALGAKVHVVRAGAHKGVGVPGTPVTDAQLADVQRVVDSINTHFLAAVASGRKLPLARVAELADGRVHVGVEAQRLGLIDGVLSYDSFRSQVQAAFSQSQMKGSQMFANEKAKGQQSEAFWEAVEARIKAGKPRDKAIEATVIAEPELHRAMLAEVNR